MIPIESTLFDDQIRISDSIRRRRFDLGTLIALAYHPPTPTLRSLLLLLLLCDSFMTSFTKSLPVTIFTIFTIFKKFYFNSETAMSLWRLLELAMSPPPRWPFEMAMSDMMSFTVSMNVNMNNSTMFATYVSQMCCTLYWSTHGQKFLGYFFPLVSPVQLCDISW